MWDFLSAIDGEQSSPEETINKNWNIDNVQYLAVMKMVRQSERCRIVKS